MTGLTTDDVDEIIVPPPTKTNPLPMLNEAFRVDNREQLLFILNRVPGRQLLVFDSKSLRTLLLRQVLSDPHTRVFKGKKNYDSFDSFPTPRGLSIIGTRLLEEQAKSLTEMFNAMDVDVDDTADVVTYFLRGELSANTSLVTQLIRSWKSKTKVTHHQIVYLPQSTALTNKLLVNTGMTTAPNVSIHRLQLDVFPLDSDLLSFEYENALKEADLEGTPSPAVSTIARSLLKIQEVVGRIPRVQAIGPLAEEVLKKMMSLTLDEHMTGYKVDTDTYQQEASAMMILDRKVDFVTPFLTPLTYEGLLDELVDIECGFITINLTQIHPDSDTDEFVCLGLADSLFEQTRDQHVEKIGSFLQEQAKTLQASHADFTNKEKKKDLSEIHLFVKNIPVFAQSLSSLNNHIHLAESIKGYTEQSSFRKRWQSERSMIEGESCYDLLEEWIACQFPAEQILRLLVVQSITGGGIKSSKYDSLRRDIVSSYGQKYLHVLHDLEKVGLLRRREWMDTSPFATLRKNLALINAEVDPIAPDDISYVSSGYAPLSVRLVQAAVRGWNGAANQDSLKELPGRLIDVLQRSPPEDFLTAIRRSPTESLSVWAEKRKSQSNKRKPTLIVLYIGGVTYMEIAALRFLSGRASFPYHIVICTTKVVNGSAILRKFNT